MLFHAVGTSAAVIEISLYVVGYRLSVAYLPLSACGLVLNHAGVLDVQADLVHNVAVAVDLRGHKVN